MWDQNAALDFRLFASGGGDGEEGDIKHFKVVMFVFEKSTFWKDMKDHLIMWLRWQEDIEMIQEIVSIIWILK